MGNSPVEVAPAVQLYIIWHGFWLCGWCFAGGRAGHFVLLILVRLDLDRQRFAASDTKRHFEVCGIVMFLRGSKVAFDILWLLSIRSIILHHRHQKSRLVALIRTRKQQTRSHLQNTTSLWTHEIPNRCTLLLDCFFIYLLAYQDAIKLSETYECHSMLTARFNRLLSILLIFSSYLLSQ